MTRPPDPPHTPRQIMYAGMMAPLVPEGLALSELWQRWIALRARLDRRQTDERAQESLETAFDRTTDALLSGTPATLGDIGLKLATLLELAPIRIGLVDEFPWPELAVVLDDLVRLSKT